MVVAGEDADPGSGWFDSSCPSPVGVVAAAVNAATQRKETGRRRLSPSGLDRGGVRFAIARSAVHAAAFVPLLFASGLLSEDDLLSDDLLSVLEPDSVLAPPVSVFDSFPSLASPPFLRA